MVVVALVLVVSATGITLYTKERNNRIERARLAYAALVIPKDDNYNNGEKDELRKLLDRRESLLASLDFAQLESLQTEFDALVQRVNDRWDTEGKRTAKKSEVEAVQLVDGANESESEIFNTRKQQLLDMIERGESNDAINAALAVLKQTNDDIQQRIEAASVSSYQGGSDGGYTPPASTPSRNGGGSSQGGSNQRGGGNGGNSNGGSSEKRCRTLPDGSQRCIL